MKSTILFISFFLLSVITFGQESKLAQQYFNNGEFEKASVLYEKLHKDKKGNNYFFERFVECLIELEDYKRAESEVKKGLKKNPKDVRLYVTYGTIFERQFMDDKATAQYKKAIKKLPAEKYKIIQLANAFTRLTKYKMAIETYEKGADILNNRDIFAYNLGELYRQQGDNPKMIEAYLNSLNENPGRIETLKTRFQRFLQKDDYQELQTQLYALVQKDKNAVYFIELLAWVFVQNKDYHNALRQEKALDKRLNENGTRIYKLAEIAANDKDYDAAIEAYDYLISEKGKNSSYYIDAKRETLRCKRDKLVSGFDFSKEDLLFLEKEYELFLQEFGSNKTTASIILELAELEAFYLNDMDKAIAYLEEMIKYPDIDKIIRAQGKLALGDFYLMKSNIWDATLLYSQVDKEFKDDVLGHEARYRNARLSYYAGDFLWAQAQFNVLKASTSKLIANDALDRSIFIMDNMGLDTTTAALELYSKAELLTFQNKLDDAIAKLDTLKNDFPEHTLQDDILYAEAKIFYKKRDFTKAAELLQKIVNDHAEEIRADNALFELAEIYETRLNDLEKAKELYEKLFLEYSGSTFAVDARKRFRKLRGDDI